MLISTAYAVANTTAEWLQILLSGAARWWMLTMSTRNEEPRKREGVSSTTSPRGVLLLAGPPLDPSIPDHSASCPTMYVMLNAVASTADQNPTALVAAEIGTAIAS